LNGGSRCQKQNLLHAGLLLGICSTVFVRQLELIDQADGAVPVPHVTQRWQMLNHLFGSSRLYSGHHAEPVAAIMPDRINILTSAPAESATKSQNFIYIKLNLIERT